MENVRYGFFLFKDDVFFYLDSKIDEERDVIV